MDVKGIICNTVFNSDFVTEYFGFEVRVPRTHKYTQYGEDFVEVSYSVTGAGIKEDFHIGYLLSKLSKVDEENKKYEELSEYLNNFLNRVRVSLEKAIENKKNFETDLSIVKGRVLSLKYKARGEVCPHIEITSKDGKLRVTQVDKNGGSVTIL